MLNIINNSQASANNLVEVSFDTDFEVSIADEMLSSLRDDTRRVEKMVKEYEQIAHTKKLSDRFAKATLFANQMYSLVRDLIIYNPSTGSYSAAYMVWDRFAKRLEYKAKLGISDKNGLRLLGENVYALEREMNKLVDTFRQLNNEEELAINMQ